MYLLIFLNGHFQNYKTGQVEKNNNKEVLKLLRKTYTEGKNVAEGKRAVESKQNKVDEEKNRSIKWKRFIKELNRRTERKRDFYV